jgi:hypothetical protein
MAIEGVVPAPKLSKGARPTEPERAAESSGMKRSRKSDSLAELSRNDEVEGTSLTPQMKRLKTLRM